MFFFDFGSLAPHGSWKSIILLAKSYEIPLHSQENSDLARQIIQKSYKIQKKSTSEFTRISSLGPSKIKTKHK